MKGIICFMTFVLMFVSCNDEKDIAYKSTLELIGNSSEPFSNLGEEREFVVKHTSSPAISEQEIEYIIKHSDIIFTSENGNFSISNYLITGNSISFKIICAENKTDKIIEDKIRVHIINDSFNEEITEDLKQEASELKYEYRIESEITKSYIIPAEGGVFNIPIQGYRSFFLNNQLVSEVPYNLTGLHFISNNVNTASVHNTFFVYGDSDGKYFIRLVAQPYNYDGDYLWEVEIRFGDKILYHLDIFHQQTAGEEYSVLYSKTTSENIFIDK